MIQKKYMNNSFRDELLVVNFIFSPFIRHSIQLTIGYCKISIDFRHKYLYYRIERLIITNQMNESIKWMIGEILNDWRVDRFS